MEAVNLSKKNVSEDLKKGDWGQRKRNNVLNLPAVTPLLYTSLRVRSSKSNCGIQQSALRSHREFATTIRSATAVRTMAFGLAVEDF
jgi:hypothetical protein